MVLLQHHLAGTSLTVDYIPGQACSTHPKAPQQQSAVTVSKTLMTFQTTLSVTWRNNADTNKQYHKAGLYSLHNNEQS